MKIATHLSDVATVHLFDLRRTAFVLWRLHHVQHPPRIVIGRFAPGNPPTLAESRRVDFEQSPDHSDLWLIDAIKCGLDEGQTYHYWFEVTDSSPSGDGSRVRCTDPLAFTVDWRLVADESPAAVVRFANGELVPCDPGGDTFDPAPPIAADVAPSNNRTVIYELPTSWTKINIHGDPQLGVGTFADVRALVDANAEATNFAGVGALRVGRSHLMELGVNALELLPVADSFVEREWGYATSNYFAPDHDLGFPAGHSSPTPHADLLSVIAACHRRGIRFIADMVMAFGTRAAMETVNFPEFHIDPRATPHDPDAQQSGGQGIRDGFGGCLWRYARSVDAYDPLSGATMSLVPARQFMKAYLLRWMSDFAIDGIRMDSVNNVSNWDFVQEFKDLARNTWRDRGGADDTFLVVGEELSVPLDLLRQNRLDGLWNEDFKRMIRNAILGRNDDEEPSFEWTVRKMIDCRLVGFRDGEQAVNYVGSHDVEGFRNERLFAFLHNNGIVFKEERIKLAFTCLLTAVGIPMIFAGDEFADEHDLSVSHPPKQRDAVNFERLAEPFRRRVFDYVARLVKLRTTSEALAVDDTDFIHVDFNNGKRVVAWRRGRRNSEHQVVVVANFSDFVTANAGSAGAEYRVANWPATPTGTRWREITQERDVPQEWIAREPLYPWEAKVYTLVDA
jgi:pullulanase